ncbi:MAG TPA: cyclic nucleotide-binding domain-containing protein [Candidatus Hydrogenedentes bacterium]|nr:MAG: Cyclic nucleotide-gated potassium channel [Candidatus Hydrogenedentes bacterium ADurb.Bin170]HNZ48469.1 cyclic nucleotide-binding domain-containing protein [Candidatus Hydrogenedentota bacterium]HOH42364.1 cyclic nucleotide-binding domain-containing protein [Candidatus Hydrogenedentota bacterium]HOM47525.1 cyclic nucleotide-binding domain-containing protein [Candidatus Hydrogenedentota bacterium]HOR49745.1 cyclic nucleotide-binding domain-containing protein [Candidatus Hydrogenedentota 
MTSEKIRQLAQRVPLFHALDGADIEKIVSRGMTMRMLKGETLFYKGTSGNQMYVVLAGKLGVYNGETMIATLRPGDMCGEMALVNHETRSATVKLEEDSLLFVLTETTLNKLLTKRVAVQLLLNIIATLSKRLQEANKRTAP